jgi:hypothetical protein
MRESPARPRRLSPTATNPPPQTDALPTDRWRGTHFLGERVYCLMQPHDTFAGRFVALGCEPTPASHALRTSEALGAHQRLDIVSIAAS